jgi:hypothetical protein
MVNSTLTFFEKPKGLSVGKDALYVDADGSLVRVLAPFMKTTFWMRYIWLFLWRGSVQNLDSSQAWKKIVR